MYRNEDPEKKPTTLNIGRVDPAGRKLPETEWREAEDRTPFYLGGTPMTDRYEKRFTDCETHGRQPVADHSEGEWLETEKCIPCIIAGIRSAAETEVAHFQAILDQGGEDYRIPKTEAEMSPAELEGYRRHQQTMRLWSRELLKDAELYAGKSFLAGLVSQTDIPNKEAVINRIEEVDRQYGVISYDLVDRLRQEEQP